MFLHAKRWGAYEDAEYEEALIEEILEVDGRSTAVGVGILRQPIDDRNTRLSIQVSGYISEIEFEDIHTTMVRISNAVCPTCTRKAGNYFEATVQLRSSGRRLGEDELNSLRGTFNDYLSSIEPDPMFFINKEGAVTGGYDMVLGSKSFARGWTKHLLKRFGGTSKETNSIVGRKDGEDLTRLTISYRKPAFDIGDVIKKKDRLWLICSWQRDGATITAVDRQERTGLSWRDLEKMAVVCQVKEQMEIEILNLDSSAAEFMDPRDWKMKAVALPYDFEASRKILRIAFIADEWVALPRIGGGGLDD